MTVGDINVIPGKAYIHTLSGDYVVISGTIFVQSGVNVIISGQPVSISGQPVIIGSGLSVIVQSGVNVVGNFTSTVDVSGQPVEISGQPVIVAEWKQINDLTILADGTEQTLVDSVLQGQYWGYVNLNPMLLGDQVTLRQYIYSGGAPSLYREKTYSGPGVEFQIGFRPKPVTTGYKVTLQQIAGIMRTYSYSFNYEKWEP